jgi:hypothetical protein
MRSRFVALAAGLLLICALSCKKDEAEVSAALPASAAPEQAQSLVAQDRGAAPAAGEAAGPTSPARPVSRKLVRTVHLVLEVRDPEQAAADARRVAGQLGGYVAAVDAQRRDDLPFVRLTLRIPAERLDAALAEIRKLARRVEREAQSTEDVTDRWVDLDARLRTCRPPSASCSPCSPSRARPAASSTTSSPSTAS